MHGSKWPINSARIVQARVVAPEAAVLAEGVGEASVAVGGALLVVEGPALLTDNRCSKRWRVIDCLLLFEILVLEV